MEIRHFGNKMLFFFTPFQVMCIKTAEYKEDILQNLESRRGGGIAAGPPPGFITNCIGRSFLIFSNQYVLVLHFSSKLLFFNLMFYQNSFRAITISNVERVWVI